MIRRDGRTAAQIRPVSLERGFVTTSHGSVLYRAGGTVLLVTANLLDKVPPFLEGKGKGWLTAEYAMLPGSTPGRKSRGQDGRSTEIQRLIGRSLRAIIDLDLLGPKTLHVDADVLQADGGTRTAAITAAAVAVADALDRQFGPDARSIQKDLVAAISVGLVGDHVVLDLDYPEDSSAVVDFNIVRLAGGGLVEAQGTGEGGTFSRDQLQAILDLAEQGLDQLTAIQKAALGWSQGQAV